MGFRVLSPDLGVSVWIWGSRLRVGGLIPDLGNLIPDLGGSSLVWGPLMPRSPPHPAALALPPLPAPGMDPPGNSRGGVGVSLERPQIPPPQIPHPQIPHPQIPHPLPGLGFAPCSPQTLRVLPHSSHPAAPHLRRVGDTSRGHRGDSPVFVPERVAAGTALSPTLVGTPRTHRRLRAPLQLWHKLSETKGGGRCPLVPPACPRCPRCPQTGWCHQELMRARGAQGGPHAPGFNPSPAAASPGPPGWKLGMIPAVSRAGEGR